MDSTTLWPRQTRSHSTGQLTADDVLNHALERRKALSSKASEESARMQKQRAQQRQKLTESMLGEQQKYLEQLTAAFCGR